MTAWVLRLAVSGAAWLGGAACAAAQSPYRFDDDLSAYVGGAPRVGLYDSLKYIPLTEDADTYVSFGADLRERAEMQSNALLGYRTPGGNVYDLHRLLVFADLQYHEFRAFVQFGDETEAGRKPGPLPTDVDRLDLAQAFLDFAMPAGPATLTVRAGRFEMAFDEGALIGLRDGPNVRQVWDGVQSFAALPYARVDAFLVRPVNVAPGDFDDRDLAGQTLWGVHVSASPAWIAPFRLTAFYYGNTMPKVLFFPRPGREDTHTAGVRLLAAGRGLDGSIGAIGQVGRFAQRDVSAWGLHADAGYTFAGTWSPRLGLRADALSGGGGATGPVHTFNALYPNYAYSTEATIEAPSNLIQPGVTLALHPARPVALNSTVEGLWRENTRDAFYVAPTLALIAPGGSTNRFSGTEVQQEASWQINKVFNLTGAYVHFAPAAFLRAAHARAQDFGMTEISVRF